MGSVFKMLEPRGLSQVMQRSLSKHVWVQDLALFRFVVHKTAYDTISVGVLQFPFLIILEVSPFISTFPIDTK